MIVCFHRNKQTVNKYKLKFERKFSKKIHFYYESKLVKTMASFASSATTCGARKHVWRTQAAWAN